MENEELMTINLVYKNKHIEQWTTLATPEEMKAFNAELDAFIKVHKVWNMREAELVTEAQRLSENND